MAFWGFWVTCMKKSVGRKGVTTLLVGKGVGLRITRRRLVRIPRAEVSDGPVEPVSVHHLGPGGDELELEERSVGGELVNDGAHRAVKLEKQIRLEHVLRGALVGRRFVPVALPQSAGGMVDGSVPKNTRKTRLALIPVESPLPRKQVGEEHVCESRSIKICTGQTICAAIKRDKLAGREAKHRHKLIQSDGRAGIRGEHCRRAHEICPARAFSGVGTSIAEGDRVMDRLRAREDDQIGPRKSGAELVLDWLQTPEGSVEPPVRRPRELRRETNASTIATALVISDAEG
mmetsp:Transcript_45072/g.105295  ORF Transcript_45072/g.105295 Transcript_45072/m.105295 type:complete len:289 (-) Transcript_45072:476-1342(-)